MVPAAGWVPHKAACDVEAAAGLGRGVVCQVSRKISERPALEAAGGLLLTRASNADPWRVRDLGDIHLPEIAGQELVGGVVDPSNDADMPGWVLRNPLLALVVYKPGEHCILAVRDVHLRKKDASEELSGRKYELFEEVGSPATEYATVTTSLGCGTVEEYFDHTHDPMCGLLEARLYRRE